MVAYNFRLQFADLIIAGAKRQTVRAKRHRQARPGERLQLYTGMRTSACRKLLTDGPVCVRVDDIEIGINDLVSARIAYIAVNGRYLDKCGIETFARADGFRPGKLGWTARHAMGAFWERTHGIGRFRGDVIYWLLIDRGAEV